MGPLCTVFMKRISRAIADDNNEAISLVTNFIRTNLRFSLLKCTLIALRGVRGKADKNYTIIYDISFNLIPQRDCYEVPWRLLAEEERRQAYIYILFLWVLVTKHIKHTYWEQRYSSTMNMAIFHYNVLTIIKFTLWIRLKELFPKYGS